MRQIIFSTLLVVGTVVGFAAPVMADDVIDGRTGQNSVYRLVRLSNWNGILVLYAHGRISKDILVAITDDDELCDLAARTYLCRPLRSTMLMYFSRNARWSQLDRTQIRAD